MFFFLLMWLVDAAQIDPWALVFSVATSGTRTAGTLEKRKELLTILVKELFFTRDLCMCVCVFPPSNQASQTCRFGDSKKRRSVRDA